MRTYNTKPPISNRLDRNNIAAVRLAGLQDELNLSSTEYQVRDLFILDGFYYGINTDFD